jgi:hypothetical protein
MSILYWNQNSNIFIRRQNMRERTHFSKIRGNISEYFADRRPSHGFKNTGESWPEPRNHCLLYPPCVLYSSTLLVNRSVFKFEPPSSSDHQRCRKLFVRHRRASPQARPVKPRLLGLQGLSRATKKQITVVVALHSPNPITVSRQGSNGEVLSLL